MQEINLYNLLKYYAKHWLIVVLFTSVGLGIGIFYNTFMQVPLYKSEATLLLVNPDSAASPQDTTLINNYIELFKSRRVLQPVIDQEKLNTSYNQFVGTVGAANDKSTQVIKVSITSKSPVVSRTSTDAAIVSFKSQVTTLYNTDNVSVVDSASLPDLPYNIHKSIQLLLATAAGLILAVVGLFFAFDFKESKLGTNGLQLAEPALSLITADGTLALSAVEIQARQAAALQAKQTALLAMQSERDAAEMATREANKKRQAEKAQARADKKVAKAADKEDRAAARQTAKTRKKHDRLEKKAAKLEAESARLKRLSNIPAHPKTKSNRSAVAKDIRKKLSVLGRSITKKMREDWDETQPLLSSKIAPNPKLTIESDVSSWYVVDETTWSLPAAAMQEKLTIAVELLKKKLSRQQKRRSQQTTRHAKKVEKDWFYHRLNETAVLANRRPYGKLDTTRVLHPNRMTNRIRRVFRARKI